MLLLLINISVMPVVGGMWDDSGSMCAVVGLTGVVYILLLLIVVFWGRFVCANTVHIDCSALGSLIIPILTSNITS